MAFSENCSKAIPSGYDSPDNELQALLVELWVEVLRIDRIGIRSDFFALGGDSIKGALLVNQLQQRLDSPLYVTSLFDAPTIEQFSQYLEQHYPRECASMLAAPSDLSPEAPLPVDAEKVALLRRLIPPLTPAEARPGEPKNPPGVFILAPPRSGSTLLRAMLAGHPRLFAPPELVLLPFNTLQERAEAFTGRNSHWLEGSVRALMQLKELDAEAAQRMMQELTNRGLSVKAFYRQLQRWIGDRRLVDKSTTYPLRVETLERAEAMFSQPLYIHLQRHPYGMIRSFEKAHLDRVFFQYQHPFSVRELAELIWTIGYQNILAFLQQIPEQRQYTVKFEELLSRPRQELGKICEFLGLEPVPTMLAAQSDRKTRMTDGLHPQSIMVGDPGFHQFHDIEPSVAERWRADYRADFLGGPASELAHKLGYRLIKESTQRRLPVQQSQDERVAEPQGEGVPLADAQRRIWFLEQLEGTGGAYNMHAVYRINGGLDTAVLERCIREIMERHEPLRASFWLKDGRPVQRFSDEAVFSLRVQELSGLAPEELAAQLDEQIEKEVLKPFALDKPPLMRLLLLRVKGRAHTLVLVIHHLISDDWSMQRLVEELNSLYSAYSRNQPATLPVLPMRYRDFALAQGKRGHESDLEYWKSELKNAPALLDLPLDHPRPLAQTFRGSSLGFQVDADLSERLKQLGRQGKATLYMSLLTAFSILMYRYSGQTDIVLGTPVANRSRREQEPIIGLFVNTLAIRIDLSGDPGFLPLLKRVRKRCLGAFAHQQAPFERLVKMLDPARDMSYSPLFQVMFIQRNAPEAATPPSRPNFVPSERRSYSAKFDITLYVEEHQEGIGILLEYNTDLFEPATIHRLGGHFLTLLRSIVQQPELPISRLPLLSPGELDRLLVDWNATESDYPRDRALPSLLAEQAQRTPEAIALVFGKQRMTYRTLDQRANQLARHLLSLGAGPEVLVALCCERNLGVVVALLAILKSGSAYLPLDPGYPRERLDFMLADSGTRFLLTEQSVAAKYTPSNVQTICMDRDQAEIALQDSSEPAAVVSCDSLAYVIYTSGSTGRPKGVQITHRALNNFLFSMRQRPGLDSSDRLLALTTISFDIAALEIFLPLLCGAQVLLQSRDTAVDARRLMVCLPEATVMQATPATWRILLAAGWEGLPHLRALCGGEALSHELAERLLGKCGELWNLYGPTETTVWSTIARVTSPSPGGKAPMTIGRPIANTRIYILDRQMQPTPIGVPGELFIAGEGLARGYLNRAELSAERFLHCPFTQFPGSEADHAERMYRTGDLVRYRDDGEIEFLGRIDHQVKLHGYRIELGEIESALTKHVGIRQCVAIVREDQPGDQRLVAYLLAESPDSPPEVFELRTFLRRSLPVFMVPNVFAYVDAFPLTPNGKIDRGKLPAPEVVRTESDSRLSMPRDDIEMHLKTIWGQVLQCDKVGLQDNFYALGGHSLTAVSLMAKIRQRFGRELSLASLFQGPTVEQQASLLRRNLVAQDTTLMEIQPSGTHPPLFAVHPIGGSVLCYAGLAQRLGSEQPFYGLQAVGLAPGDWTIEGMSGSYLGAIRAVQPQGPYRLCGWSLGGVIAFEMARQLRLAGEDVALLALLDSRLPPVKAQELDQAGMVLALAEHLGKLHGYDLGLRADELRHLDPRRRLGLLLRVARRHGILAPETSPEQLDGLLATFSRCMHALERYRIRPYQGKLTLFQTGEAGLAEDWRDLVDEIEVHGVPGDHYSMLSEPHLSHLSRQLREVLPHF